MKVNNVSLSGLYESIVASGYAMKIDDICAFRAVKEKDMKRAESLGKTLIGSGHDQFLTGINVSFDLSCTNKMWVELERYRFIFFVTSQSTMHKLSQMDLSKCYNEYVDKRIITIMEELKEKYNKTKNTEDFLRLVYSNPSGCELTARLTTNYRSLKTVYSQRKDHKLPEWREFCKWVETLPYFKSLVLGGVSSED